jgi:hypothetical protein
MIVGKDTPPKVRKEKTIFISGNLYQWRGAAFGNESPRMCVTIGAKKQLIHTVSGNWCYSPGGEYDEQYYDVTKKWALIPRVVS